MKERVTLFTVALLLFVEVVTPCMNHKDSSYSTTTTRLTTSQPPNQLITPSPPVATATSTKCGHNMYYNTNTAPGAAIVNGVNALPNQYPWLVRLRIVNGSTIKQCSATIVGTKTLLTTARCAKYANVASDITAFFGDWNKDATDSGEYQVPITSILVHTNYVAVTYDYDFALLKFDTAIDFTKSWSVQQICPATSCLATGGCGVATVAYIAGWGSPYEGTPSTSSILQSAYVKIADRDVCTSQYSQTVSTITDRMTCAGYPGGGVDTCTGDGGSPLMVMEDGYYKLCGIASFGAGCARANAYGVYARVCSVTDWLTANVV